MTMLGLVQLMSVYTESTESGRFEVLIADGVPCRVAALGGNRLRPNAPFRTEYADEMRLLWGADLELPDHCQVEVEGERWNPIAPTYYAPRGPNGQVHHRSAIIAREQGD